MSLGPVELVVIRFPGNHFTGDIAAALRQVVEQGLIRVIDLTFVSKDTDGAVTLLEITDLDDDAADAYYPVVHTVSSLLSEDDVRQIGAGLEPSSSAAALLVEHTWATALRDSIRNANGEVLLNERIPASVIEELVAQSSAS